ncbi:Vacuolar protein sorting-associated protein ist1 [Coemansia sp. BCRC 34301]|nr:Vacuolar protein sorting-associated protein ist1 [Coemansia sp. BCRC 34301]
MPFQVTKFKVELKLAINRLKLLQAKKSSLNLKARREIAPLLEAGKIESATIRVENIIREDLNVEALEMVELYCELLTARVGLVDQSRTIDPGVSEAVHSIIYASSRIDIRELTMLRDMLTAKYGKELVLEATENSTGAVNAKLVRKLSVNTPPDSLIKMYLREIACFYHVKWRPDDDEDEEEGVGDSDEDTPSGGLKEPASAGALEDILAESESSANPGVYSGDELSSDKNESLSSALLARPAAATTATAIAADDELETEGPVPEPPIALPAPVLGKPVAKKPAGGKAKVTAPQQQSGDGGDIPSLADLQRRFEALKRT